MNKNIIVIGVIAVVAVFAIMSSLKGNTVDIDAVLKEAQSSEKLVLLELSSPTCSTCRRMQPYLQEIEVEYADKVVIKTIDVASRTDVAKRFGVTAIPTQVFIDKLGNEYFKHVGYFSKNEILKVLREKGL